MSDVTTSEDAGGRDPELETVAQAGVPGGAEPDGSGSGEADGDGVDGVDVGDLAADYVEGLLDICDLDGDIDIEEAGGRTTVVVTAEEGTRLDLLSGPETVTALQELTRLAVQARTGGFARLTLDIGGSRDMRTRELREVVDAAAQRLAAGEERVALEPMSSYERKLVHDLAAERGLTSESEGEGPGRHTVLSA